MSLQTIYDKMKRQSLGIPLAIAGTGTLVSLLAGKKYHAAFGTAWAVLSLWHGLQHYVLRRPRKKPANELRQIWSFLRTAEVASFVPGRVRLRSKALAGNERLAERAKSRIEGIIGVKEVKANPMTGSLLIIYDREFAAANPKLSRMARIK